MSLFGRKEKRRIKELEEALEIALHDMTNVTVSFPPPVYAQVFRAVRKGRWYRFTTSFKVDDSGSSLTGAGLFEDSRVDDYFDGQMKPSVYDWTGESQDGSRVTAVPNYGPCPYCGRLHAPGTAEGVCDR